MSSRSDQYVHPPVPVALPSLAWRRETVFAFPPIIERLSQLLLDVRHVESVLLLHFIRVLGETKALRRWPRFPRAGS